MVEVDNMLAVRPDFIIVGAMKCGTTSMHHLLAMHPDVYMPSGEVQLLSIDDIEQNPVFFVPGTEAWSYQNFEAYFGTYNKWHSSLYAGVGEARVLGEDAPSYLPSRTAIERIAQLLPETKLIVMLRDPVERLYSQYWHWVRSYRAIYSLEETIYFQHGNIMQRSLYEEQMRYVFEHIPRSQVLVVLFEEFIREQSQVMNRVYDFIGLDGPVKRPEPSKSHANRGHFPRFPSLALWRNRLLRHRYGRRYQTGFPRMPGPPGRSMREDLMVRAMNWINPHTMQRPPSMDMKTRQFLERLLYDRNRGLPDLIDGDLPHYWPTFRNQQ